MQTSILTIDPNSSPENPAGQGSYAKYSTPTYGYRPGAPTGGCQAWGSSYPKLNLLVREAGVEFFEGPKNGRIFPILCLSTRVSGKLPHY